jgi:hypothetical protein
VQVAVGVAHLEFVVGTRADIGNKQLPHTAATTRPHRVAQPVPVIEIAYHTDPIGVWGPGGETHPLHPLVLHTVGTEYAVDMLVLALPEEMQVQVADYRVKPIGVFDLHPVSRLCQPAKPVFGSGPVTILETEQGRIGTLPVATQQGEGIVMPPLQQALEVLRDRTSGRCLFAFFLIHIKREFIDILF